MFSYYITEGSLYTKEEEETEQDKGEEREEDVIIKGKIYSLTTFTPITFYLTDCHKCSLFL